jgi:hypothetical protein
MPGRRAPKHVVVQHAQLALDLGAAGGELREIPLLDLEALDAALELPHALQHGLPVRERRLVPPLARRPLRVEVVPAHAERQLAAAALELGDRVVCRAPGSASSIEDALLRVQSCRVVARALEHGPLRVELGHLAVQRGGDVREVAERAHELVVPCSVPFDPGDGRWWYWWWHSVWC